MLGKLQGSKKRLLALVTQLFILPMTNGQLGTPTAGWCPLCKNGVGEFLVMEKCQQYKSDCDYDQSSNNKSIVSDVIGETRPERSHTYPITKKIVSLIVHRDEHDFKSTGITFYYAYGTFTKIGDVIANSDAKYNTSVPGSLIGFQCQFNQNPVGSTPQIYENCYGCIPYLLQCQDFSLDDRTISNMSVEVGAAAATQDVTFTIGNGGTGCGPRVYTMSPSYSFLTLSGEVLNPLTGDNEVTLSFQTNNYSDEGGPFTVTMSVSLSDFPSIAPISKTFQLTVRCTLTSMVFNAGIPTSSIINLQSDQPFRIPFSVTKTAPCTLAPTFTLSQSLPFLQIIQTGNTGELVINNAFPSDIDIYTLTLTGAQGGLIASHTISLELRDLCMTSIIVASPDPPALMTAVMPMTGTLTQTLSISTDVQLANPAIICTKFTTMSPAVEFVYLAADSKSIILEKTKVSLPVNLGVHQFTITTTSANYPTTVAPKTMTFQVQITCVVTNLEVTSKPPDASYELNTGATTTLPFQFKQTDACQLPYTFSHVVKKDGITIPQPSWLTFDTTSRTYTYAPTAATDAAVYSITITAFVQSLQISDNFTLTVKQINRPPAFKTALSQVAIPKTEASTPWSFVMPSVIDPDNDNVLVTVNYGYAGFVRLVEADGVRYLVIEDISIIPSGMFVLLFSLDDGRHKVFVPLTLLVFDLPVLPAVVIEVPIASVNATQNTTTTAELSEAEPAELEKKDPLAYLSEEWKNKILALFQKVEQKKKENPRWQPVAPNPYISKVTSTGVVTINFLSNIIKVPDLKMINNGTVFLYDDELENSRNLASYEGRKGKEVPVLQIEVLPGIESNETYLGFVWNCTKETESQLQIQLFFENPIYVSANPVPDKIRVTFNDPSLFVGTVGNTMDKTSKSIEKYLPSQISTKPGSQAVVVEQTVQTVAQTTKVVVATNFLLNSFISAALNQLWNMINTQQVIILMPLFKVQLPGNAQSFFNKLFQIAAFDIFEIEDPVNSILRLNKTEALNANFAALGFQSIYFLNNLGPIFVVFMLYFAAIFVLLTLDMCAHKSDRFASFVLWSRKKMFYNTIIGIVTESYSYMAVCCIINLTHVTFKSPGEIVQTLICFLALLTLIGFPIIMTWYAKKTIQSSEKQEQEKIFNYLEELSLRKGASVLMFPFFFLLRRLLIAASVVMLNHLFAQFFVMASLNITAVILVGYVKPFEDPFRLGTEMVNEVAIMFVLYCIICFSPLTEPSSRSLMGIICCVIVSIHMAANLLLILFNMAKRVLFIILLWNSRLKLRRQRKKMRDYMLNVRAIRRLQREDKNYDQSSSDSDLDELFGLDLQDLDVIDEADEECEASEGEEASDGNEDSLRPIPLEFANQLLIDKDALLLQVTESNDMLFSGNTKILSSQKSQTEKLCGQPAIPNIEANETTIKVHQIQEEEEEEPIYCDKNGSFESNDSQIQETRVIHDKPIVFPTHKQLKLKVNSSRRVMSQPDIPTFPTPSPSLSKLLDQVDEKIAADREIEQLDDPESFIRDCSLFSNSKLVSAKLTTRNLPQPIEATIVEESKEVYGTIEKRGWQLNDAEEMTQNVLPDKIKSSRITQTDFKQSVPSNQLEEDKQVNPDISNLLRVLRNTKKFSVEHQPKVPQNPLDKEKLVNALNNVFKDSYLSKRPAKPIRNKSPLKPKK